MAFWHVWSESQGIETSVSVRRVLQSGGPARDSGEREPSAATRPSGGTDFPNSSNDVWALETETYGTILLAQDKPLRGSLQPSPYHEMLVHPAMNAHPAPKAALLFGGSDGASLELLLSYPSLESVTVAGLDETVAKTAAAWFPTAHSAFSDQRLRVSSADASIFARDCRDRFDVVIIDPVAPLCSLSFPQSFFCDCFRLLTGDGVLACDCGPADPKSALRETGSVVGKVRRLFPVFKPYRAPGRLSCERDRIFGFAAKTFDPTATPPSSRWKTEGARAGWYNDSMHRAAFALPTTVEAMLETV
ncbi:MAG: hypothetical protein ABFC81_07430 [Rectinema sp.]